MYLFTDAYFIHFEYRTCNAVMQINFARKEEVDVLKSYR